ncbi:MAG: transporter [Bacteroidota bacterium]
MIFVVVDQAICQVYPITDRSLAYTTAATIPAGSLQLESGYFGVHDLSKVSDLRLDGLSLLTRLGLNDRAELRLGLNGLSFNDAAGGVSGLAPVTISSKLAVIDEGLKMPAISLLAGVAVSDIASSELANETIQPSIKIIPEKFLNHLFIIGGNVGWTYLPDAPEIGYSVSLRLAITEELALYGEFYGFNSAVTEARDFVDLAFEVWAWDGVALDVALGWGITDAADGGFISLGAARYFD